jgi:uncharacterized membrane protein
MRDFRIDVEIQEPPEQVWAVMRDIERWPEWTPSVTSIQRLELGPLTVGSQALIRQPGLPPAKWTVTEADEAGRSFAWVSGFPGARVTAKHSVVASTGGSRATLSLRFSGIFGWLVGQMTADINRRYLALEAEGLKKRTEKRQLFRA